MTRVLVTGALGNVGREVARECIARGFVVRAAARDEAALRQRLPAAEAARFDFLDRSTWMSTLAGCTSLFLLRPPPLGDMRTTLNPFIDAACSAGVKQVVFLSVAGAERRPWVPHHKVEVHLQASGVGWTLLRPGFFAQNLESAYRQDIVEDSRIYVPAGSGRVAFIDVRDIAAVTALVLQEPDRFRGHGLSLTGPEAVPFSDVARTLTSVLHRPIRYEAATVPGYMWHLRYKRRMPWQQVVIQTVLHVGLRYGDAETVDPTMEELLRRPPRTLQAYIQENAAAW